MVEEGEEVVVVDWKGREVGGVMIEGEFEESLIIFVLWVGAILVCLVMGMRNIWSKFFSFQLGWDLWCIKGNLYEVGLSELLDFKQSEAQA